MDGTLVIADVASSLEAVYRADADRLWRALYAYAADAELASEALAEAYAQALRRGSAIDDPAAWTWRAAFRIAAGALMARRTSDLQPLPETGRGGREPARADRYADPDLQAALRQLPETRRGAVIPFCIKGGSHFVGGLALSQWVETTIAGRPARMRSGCGDAQALLTVGETAYVLSLTTPTSLAAMSPSARSPTRSASRLTPRCVYRDTVATMGGSRSTPRHRSAA